MEVELGQQRDIFGEKTGVMKIREKLEEERGGKRESKLIKNKV